MEHRDARCVLEHETCSFALVRTMIGYRVSSPHLAAALRCIDDENDLSTSSQWLGCPAGVAEAADQQPGGRQRNSRLLKGEGVDVSLPTRRDVNLQLWCEQEVRPETHTKNSLLAAPQKRFPKQPLFWKAFLWRETGAKAEPPVVRPTAAPGWSDRWFNADCHPAA